MKNKKMKCAAALLILLLLFSGCASKENQYYNEENNPQSGTASPVPQNRVEISLPEAWKRHADGTPILQVYQVDEETMEEMDIETYLLGVLAGEMKNDWPMEALKAQAILARTFVLKFCNEKESKYAGADISTDIEEAQAYDATGINERIEQVVSETRGLVLSYKGEVPYAWFHAHSGGVTATAKEGLNYRGDDAGYTQVTSGMESEKAPAAAKAWRAEFTQEEMIAALKSMGIQEISAVKTIEIRETGESGRAVILNIEGIDVNAPDLRIALGSTKMRSTLLHVLKLEDGRIIMEGKGYGHGVGMPQWGAYGMAQDGKTAEEIIRHYFQDTDVQKIW